MCTHQAMSSSSSSLETYLDTTMTDSSSSASCATASSSRVRQDVKDHLRSIFEFLSFSESLLASRTCRFWSSSFKTFKRSVSIGHPEGVPIAPELLNAWFRPWCDHLYWDQLFSPQDATIANVIAPQIRTLHTDNDTFVLPMGLTNLRHLCLDIGSHSWRQARDVLCMYGAHLKTLTLVYNNHHEDLRPQQQVMNLTLLHDVMTPELRQHVIIQSFDVIPVPVFDWMRQKFPSAHRSFLAPSVKHFPDTSYIGSLDLVWMHLSEEEMSQISCFQWEDYVFPSIVDGIQYLTKCTSLTALWLESNADMSNIDILEALRKHPDFLSQIRHIQVASNDDDEQVMCLDWLQDLPNLEHLVIMCALVEYENLVQNMQNLRHLHNVDLYFVGNPFTQQQQQQIRAQFPQLHQFTYHII